VIKTLPNLITFSRLLLVPVFLLITLSPTDSNRYLGAVVFIIASLSDYLDGAIARMYKAESNFGKLFDPLADKLLVLSALVVLSGYKLDQYGLPCLPGESCLLSNSWVPSWMVVIILGRELWVTGIRAMAAEQGLVLAAGFGGKLKSFLQMSAIPLLLVHDVEIVIPFSDTNTSCYVAGIYLLFLSLIVAIWSAVDYTIEVFSFHAKSQK
jgi:CDP-diacylglycerol--glycerol-3-phosphate 3-phosphatidyltransferase